MGGNVAPKMFNQPGTLPAAQQGSNPVLVPPNPSPSSQLQGFNPFNASPTMTPPIQATQPFRTPIARPNPIGWPRGPLSGRRLQLE